VVPSVQVLRPNFLHTFHPSKSHDSSVDRALVYGLDDRGPWIRFPAEAWNFSLHYHVQNGSEAQQGALSLGVKWPGREANHSPPSSAEVKECVELYVHSPNTPSWRGIQLKKAQGQLYLISSLPCLLLVLLISFYFDQPNNIW
jgi:hypothetical protein